MSTNDPLIDLPKHSPIVLEGDTQELAKSMTDEEMRAVIIMQFRMTQEILGFVRNFEHMLNAIGDSPMGMMMPKLSIPTRGPVLPNGFGGK